MFHLIIDYFSKRINIKITNKTWKGVFIMLERLIITLIFAAGFLLVCWTLMEYWLRSSRRTTETGLRDKTIFVIGKFCQAIQQKKNFRHIWMEEESEMPI